MTVRFYRRLDPLARSGAAFIDGNTRSSLLESAGDLSPMAWGDSRNVLAIADISFMVPPQDSLLDNSQLVSNFADYLTDSERTYHLADFPHFYDSGLDNAVDIVLGQSSLLGSGQQLKTQLAAYGLSSEIRAEEDPGRDMVFLGLYGDAPQVAPYLQAAGIQVDDTLRTPYTQELELTEAGVIILDHGEDDRYVLTILADTPDRLADMVNQLVSGNYRGALVSDFAGIQKFGGASE